MVYGRLGLSFAIIIVGLLSVHCGDCLTPRTGPDGRVRVLYMGDAISTRFPTPYMFMRIEPLLQVTPEAWGWES